MPDRVKPPLEKLTAHQIMTLVGLVALVAITLIFDVDVGLVAISVAVVLTLAAPGLQKRAIDEIKWPVVLPITGVLTYVGVLEEMGTIVWVGEEVADVGAPLLAALLLCYVGAVVSAFASSVGVVGTVAALAVSRRWST
jgi:di/tricarboxylate transporter